LTPPINSPQWAAGIIAARSPVWGLQTGWKKKEIKEKTEKVKTGDRRRG
jgi:hypothetical protein